MKLIIAGGREYNPTHQDYMKLHNLHEKYNIKEVVSGKNPGKNGAIGGDGFGEIFAALHGIPVKAFPADWKEYGKRAGPFRNWKMAEYATAVVLFPGGRGTNNMFRHAVKNMLLIFDWREPV